VKLRELLGTDMAGTTVRGISEAADKLGFEARAVRVDPVSFKEGGFTLPAIARTVRTDGTAHFVVVYSVSKGGKVRCMDPADDRITKKTLNEFMKNFDGALVMMVPNENFLQSKEGAKSVLSSFMGLMKPHWKLFATAIAISIVLTIFGIVISMFNKVLIDEIIPYSQDKQLVLMAIALSIVIVTQVVLGALRQHLVLYLSQKIDIPLMLGYFKHIFRLPMNFFASRKTGDIVTRFQDAGVVKEVLTSVALTVFIDVAMVVIVGAILYFMNATLFAIILLLTAISAILIFTFKGPYKKLNKKMMEQGARLNSQVIESLNGIETVKTNSSEEYVMEKIEIEYIKTLKLGFRGGVLSNIQGTLSSFAGGFGSLGMMVMGGFLVISGETTLGTLVAFSSLAGFFTDPINRLVSLQLTIQEANISLKRLSEIYEVDEEEDAESGKDAMAFADGLGDIEMTNVSFRYGSRPLVLKNISLQIPKGKKVAIVGRSGSGKTTLSKLLLKFYVPEEGTVKFNDRELNTIDAFSLRGRIGCVPQTVEMFSGTIRENILIGKPNAAPSEVATASRYAGCDVFINKLRNNYNTMLDESGGGLSGGEKQRIALARALVKNPEFIIMDEATSSLDFITEQDIYDTIFNKLKNATMLIIAHRLSTIRRCDLIYVMEKGEIVESGTHTSLLSAGGMYAELWKSQTGEPIRTIKKDDLKIKPERKVNNGDEMEYG
jgi:ATP-binding cassette subfamily B protein